MSDKRIQYTSEFKSKIAMLAIWETMTIWEICSKFELHSTQVCKWKKELQERSKELFEDKRKKDSDLSDREKQIEKLYNQVWKLTVENDWLKKKSGLFAIWN
jgi:putative transposase